MIRPCSPETLACGREIQQRFGSEPKVLYVAGPLRGDGTLAAIRYNQAQMARMARRLQALLPQAVLVIPHGNFSYVDESGEDGWAVRGQVLLACERLLLRCDGLILCGGTLSPGMARERAVAEAAGLPILPGPGWVPWPGTFKDLGVSI